MRLSPFDPLDAILSPAPAQKRVSFLSLRPYAHRGLHGGLAHERGPIENSMSAFRAALDGGFGIELDVQMSRDGVAMVFHDAQLDRLTRETGPVALRMQAELSAIALRGTTDTIPTLSDVLALVESKAVILIEIKAEHGVVGPLCLAVRRALEGYIGPVAVMSFNPQVGHWFLTHAPRIVRGLVVTEQDADTRVERLKKAVIRRLSLWRAKPDFLAYDVRDFPSRFAGGQRKRGLPVLTWTVREAHQEQVAATYADQIIFEQPRGDAP
jgi:glycerophosphoryl diester phosphodiesterase